MSRAGADLDLPVLLPDAGEARNPGDVDQHRWLAEPQLHQRHEAVASGEQLAAARRLKLRQRIVDRGGTLIVECDRDHAWPPWRAARAVNDAPQLLGPQHHVDVLHAELAQRVNRRRDDAGRRAERAGFADTFRAERVDRCRCDRAVQLEAREVDRARKRVVHERPGDELTVRVVDRLLDHGLADPLREPAVNLSLHDQRVDQMPGIVHGHEFQQRRFAGLAIDLEHRDVAAERIRVVASARRRPLR